MGNVILDLAMSLDGYIAGRNDEDAGLHQWYFSPSSKSRQVIDEFLNTFGAIVMGRRAYEVGVQADGFVDNPYKMPHFVLTHSAPKTTAKGETSFTFVTEGIESVIEQAKAAAGDKYVTVAGGANIAQQALNAGLIDEIQIHLVPILCGQGKRLFDHLDSQRIELEYTRVIESTGVTHLRFRVVKEH
jgi:dihydrofolate reductase